LDTLTSFGSDSLEKLLWAARTTEQEFSLGIITILVVHRVVLASFSEIHRLQPNFFYGKGLRMISKDQFAFGAKLRKKDGLSIVYLILKIHLATMKTVILFFKNIKFRILPAAA
jgi:hypothetical protein